MTRSSRWWHSTASSGPGSRREPPSQRLRPVVMCGIAGIVSFDGGPVDRGSIERMVEALAHRGPDGRGLYCDGGVGLGHLRLSILDPTPAGAQPMLRSRNVLVHK